MDTVAPTRSKVVAKATSARSAAACLGISATSDRNRALLAMAAGLRARRPEVLEANRVDVESSRAAGATAALLDRLSLSEARIEAMARGLEEVVSLPDPLGEGESWVRPNGLQISRIRVPLGVIAIIYEARPNVTVEAASLAFKAGNAVVLRGSSSALSSNRVLVSILRAGLAATGLPEDAICLIDDVDRDVIDELVRLNGLIDVVIPRGGDALIQRVVKSATIPVIETGVGNCHVFVDASADLDKALRIVVNAKTHRPAVCNAAESLLVHREVAPTFLPMVGRALTDRGVELRACPASAELLEGAKTATDEDFGREFLDLVMSVKVVDSVDDAVEHVNRYGTKHSESIVTEDYRAARRFTSAVDAAAVYVNASTRFTDGSEFGYGGEMGISTQKLHARGPMGLRELTTFKYIILGDGQIRE